MVLIFSFRSGLSQRLFLGTTGEFHERGITLMERNVAGTGSIVVDEENECDQNNGTLVAL